MNDQIIILINMKKTFKRISLYLVTLCLVLFSLTRKALGLHELDTDIIPRMGGMPLPHPEPLLNINILRLIIFSPVIIIGLILYGIYFTIRAKSKKKKKWLFRVATWIIVIDIIAYAAFLYINKNFWWL